MPASGTFFDSVMAPEVHNANLRKMMVPITFAGDPTNNVTPEFQHQFCHDTSNGRLYWASTTASAGWKRLDV